MASLKVAVRVRPFNQREIDMGASLIVEMDGKKTRLHKPKLSSIRDNVRDTTNDFTFDYSYWSFDATDKQYTTQEQVYKDLGTDVINCAFQGYNACVFAYGQTGSGKTYTMMGSEKELGLIPRICEAMFNRMKLGQESGTGYKTCVSYLEIYNERVKDLLGSDNSGHGLRVREHRTMGPYVEDLSQHPVSDYEEILECISQGNVLRTTASTNMNDTSSRSHAIFTITFVQAGFMDDMPSETVSKIHLVDLAGSERANATGATGQRLKEGAHINKSLVTLGSVISALADQTQPTQQKKVMYIPYRDSVLTWLLKDSLGGNSKTIMIAALSPADCNYGETLSTLRYANRAKNIINKPTINEDANVKLIRELREEIMKLKGMINGEKGALKLEMSTKVLEDLLKKEAQEKVLTEEWTEKWREAQTILREQKALGLRKSGVGVVLDSEMPHLIGIHDDVSTGVTLYSLKDGDTFIGTEESDLCQDIVLSGSGIQSNHCSIRLENGLATIYPNANAQCWLNANLIDEPSRISQGDILLLGRTNMFRYNNPAEAAKLRKEGSRSRLDLSRLSLIAASRENLTSSMYCYSDDEIAFAYPMKRGPSELQLSREYPEVQEENKKILQTIENALKQLNIEKIHMNEQYRNKVQRISEELVQLEQNQCDKMAIINCRERELIARKEMVLWEKSNANTQIEIVTKQISALQTQLDAKKRDFYDFVAREVQRLQNCGKLNEVEVDLIEHIIESDEINDKYLDVFHNQYIQDTIVKNKDEIKTLEGDVRTKERILEDNSLKLEDLEKVTEQICHNQENLIIQRTELEYEAIKMKKQSLSLNIEPAATSNPLNQLTNTLETYDTFHTATSDCSTTFSTPSGLHQTSPSVTTADLQHSQSTMSDSGVSIDDKMNLTKSTPNCVNRSDDENSLSLSCSDNFSAVIPHPICAIHKLRQRIGQQKAQIMKYLEMDCDKSVLDDRIEKLQQLQKEYFKLENSYRTETTSPYEHECCLSDGEFGGLDLQGSDDRLSILSPDVQNDGMTRSMPSIGNYNDSEYCISIPSYIVRGAGKQTHYEYEIRITLQDDKWTLLRRYSKFRDLHLKMKSSYGDKVSVIPFPSREIFSLSSSESVARNRRRHLEIYLRRLLVVCSKIPQCPIYEGANGFGLCKATLIELSSFFKKGLFESGKHGTG